MPSTKDFSHSASGSDGFKYIVRSLEALILSIILFLPAFGISIVMIFIGTISIRNSFGAPSPRGLQVIQTLFELTSIVWLVNFLWATRRLLIYTPAIFTSDSMGSGNTRTLLANGIIRERGGEVTALWLSLIALSCIFIAVEIGLGLLSAISGTAGAFLSVLGFFGGAHPTTPFSIPQGGLFGGAVPTMPFGIPGGTGVAPTAPVNGFTVISLALQLALWTLSILVGTFLCLASLVYYRAAGGGAAWFPVGVTSPVRPAKPNPPAPAAGTKETPTEKAGHTATATGVRAPDIAVLWAWLRLPDFRPLLTGKLLPHVQFLLAAPERSISAWPPDISPRAAVVIPVVAFTLLGLSAMIGNGGGFGACRRRNFRLRVRYRCIARWCCLRAPRSSCGKPQPTSAETLRSLISQSRVWPSPSALYLPCWLLFSGALASSACPSLQRSC